MWGFISNSFMSIKEILKNISEVQVKENKGNTIFATVSREKLAEVSTILHHEYKLPLSLLFGTDDRKDNETFGVHVVFENDKFHERLMLSAEIPATDPQYPALTATIMSAHWYERYLQDMFGVIAKGHPDLRRLVHHENVPQGTHPLKKDFALNTELEHANVEYPMHHVKGDGIYEIPVGPIHAGIIEPGHFRFNVAGERILTLEGKLFFTHKGVEKLIEGKTLAEALPFIERLSGDTAAAHALAYVEAAEEIAGAQISKRANMLRAMIVELERMTMHMHDLANIGGMGTGYSFIAANGFRIKERMMRLSQEIFGNRFWRGYVALGGVEKDLSKEELAKILKISAAAYAEIRNVVETALASEAFLDRLQGTGMLPLEAAKAFGALGLPARASGLDRDTRRDFPTGAYKEVAIEVATKKSSDVFARYRMRILELEHSLKFIEKLIAELPEGVVKTEFTVKDGFALGGIESWRGEILTALSVKNGVVERCFPRDPSFCNWALFGIMGPSNIVPDFPLINKSLNLSYSGTDL